MFGHDDACAVDQAFGFLPVEAGAVDEVFDVGLIGVGHRFDGGVGVEEVGRDAVDHLVGALRAEDGGDEQLPAVLVGEADLPVGELLEEAVDDVLGFSLFVHGGWG